MSGIADPSNLTVDDRGEMRTIRILVYHATNFKYLEEFDSEVF